ncbi:TlpA family protein disulfide reductase [Parapedobacter sp.]
MKTVVCFVVALITMSSLFGQEGALKVGQQAPHISLPTPDGDTISLSSLKGKLVLVDFWATWCAPCVKEQPELKALYEKYNGPNRFEIFGVSLDKRKDNWVNAIERFDIDWIQVSDLMFWKSPVARDYAIEELPFNVLIDERGTIIAINLHGEALDDFIASYL